MKFISIFIYLSIYLRSECEFDLQILEFKFFKSLKPKKEIIVLFNIFNKLSIEKI